MSRDSYRGPKLPKFLLDQVQNGKNTSKRGHANVSRKDRRKAERQQRKSLRSRPRSIASRGHEKRDFDVEKGDDHSSKDELLSSPQPTPKQPVSHAKPLKSILKKERPRLPAGHESDSRQEEESISPIVSRNDKDRLAEDDAEIAALEKRLGIKGKKSKALYEDGLDWLVDGSDSGSEDERRGLKRKRSEDARWLRDKRSKAIGEDQLDRDELEGGSEGSESDLIGIENGDSEDEELDNPFSEDEIGSDDFEGFDSEDDVDKNEDEKPLLKKERENPYVAPATKDATTVPKYVPPSLRKSATTDEEALKQLRRQVQGLLNRLSEANMLSILQSLEEVYGKNARQHVTSTLVNLLVGLVSDPSTLNDTFLILHAGFATAVFKVVGTDFGAQLLEELVENFDRHHGSNKTEGKQSLNLIAFLSCLYTFQLVGSVMIFDCIRILLDELSETNTELLLRIIRTSGQQLRQDDPSSLKDIVWLLQRSVAKVGEKNLSVRTKFMIETINNLKNNRMKTAAAASALVAEHTARMKKTLGSLNRSHSVKTTEPLRITLSDIRDSQKKGKWWLVGASYLDPAKVPNVHEGVNSAANSAQDDLDAAYESDTPGNVNLSKLARSHGMNTDVRRAIFITILSSCDYKHARIRLLKLNLKAKQMLEIPRVIVHCVRAETVSNPFYAVLARQFCGEHKLRKAFQFTLWDAFKEMDKGGEEDDGRADDDVVAEKMSVSTIVSLAKFYGTLMANGALSIVALKKLNFAYLASRASNFIEMLLTTIFVQARKGHEDFEKTIKEVFTRAAGIPALSHGLQHFLKTTVASAEFGQRKKEKKAIQIGCRVALDALSEATREAPVVEEDEEEDEE